MLRQLWQRRHMGPPQLHSASDKPIEEQWHQAAKVGDTAFLQQAHSSNSALLSHHKKGIGNTALHWAALRGHLESIEFLLVAGAAVNARNSSKATPLHKAASSGQLAAVQRLLDAGADATVRDDDGASPRSLATSQGHTEVVAALNWQLLMR